MDLSFISFVGAAVLLVFATVGGFVCMRWGWAGISLLWQRRGWMDEQVREEAARVVGIRRKP